jgi:ketosteroid isomerase-like protein
MSREDVALIRSLQGSGLDDVFAALHPDIVWTTPDDELDGGTLRGIHAVRALFESWRETFEDFWAEAEEVFELGDWVVARMRWYGTARITGMALEIRSTTAYRVRDGLIVEAREFRDTDHAVAALGR